MTPSVRVDAREVFGRAFAVIGGTPDWVDSRTVQTLRLAPGAYRYQCYAGGGSELRFAVTRRGTVDYDTGLDGIVSGRDSDTLTVHGVPVTIDARYLSELGILLNIPATHDDWIMHRTVRLVPAPSYGLIQGSAQPVGFTFAVGLDGRVRYDPGHDVTRGGFVRGLGSSTLELLGYPILIDARAADGVGVKVSPGNGLPFATSAVQLVNLLPPPPDSPFRLQIEPGAVTRVGFGLDRNGHLLIDPASARYLHADTFHGLTRLSVTAPLPRR